MKRDILNPFSILRLTNFQSLLNKKGILNKLLNYGLSLFFRFIFKFKHTSKLLDKIRKTINTENIDEFWIIRIGFNKRRNYLPFINLDPYISNLMDVFLRKMPFFCSKPERIPIGDETCQIIFIKHFFEYFKNIDFTNAIKNWYKKLIPGGILKIQFKLKNNTVKFEELQKILKQNQFYIKEIYKNDFKINRNITITAYKQKSRLSYPSHIFEEKFNEIYTIIGQNSDILKDKKKICILGFQSEMIGNYIENKENYEGEIKTFDSFNYFSKNSDNLFDFLIICNFFEYINSSENLEIFTEIKRILQPDSKILIVLPEKRHFISKETAQLFEKSIFIRTIDENNFEIEWVNLSNSFNMIQVLLKNQYSFPLKKKNIKIFLIGNYTLRYTYLINARWDSQARALLKFGYDIQILDIKDNSFPYLLERIKIFNPDILWTGSKLVIDFFKKYCEFFRNSNIKVIYWFWDVKTPIKFNFKNVIDYMFVTTKDDIPKYKQAYNIDKVFWMPASITPEFIHRNKSIKEIYDIGFAGSLDRRFHKKRTEIVEYIQQNFDLKIFNNIYNNLPEYYTQCKIVLGGSPDQKDLELYSSNRIYVCMSCGCCFITNYFKSLETLAENEKHLLWFNNLDELSFLLKKYLSDERLREEIQKSSQKLALDNHTYIKRIKNILDIINDKTEDFYGFIK